MHVFLHADDVVRVLTASWLRLFQTSFGVHPRPVTGHACHRQIESLSIHALFFVISKNRNHTMSQQAFFTYPSDQASGRIAFIQASWHRDIVEQCRLSFVSEIEALGYHASSIDFFDVAG